MDTFKFLSAVLAKDGMYCIWAFRASDNKIIQKFYTSIDTATQAAHQFDENGFDTYFALATFNDGSSRKVENVKQLKSFFLDLDCGEKKEYPSQKAAILALRCFCQQLELPTPLLINSGRGIHAYWFLKEAVSYADWIVTAERLKYTCRKEGLHQDPAVTSDGARVLRVPNTHNYKDTPPKKAGVLGIDIPKSIDFDTFSTALGTDPIPMPTVYTPNSGSSALMDALTGNVQGRFKTIMEKTMRGTGCEQIKIIMTDQETIDEPLWRAGLSIAKFCVDGEKAARKMSNKHPDYDADETYNKLDLIKGPYLCSRFNEYNEGVCEECPHWGKIKSPIVLAREIIEADKDDNVVDMFPEVIVPSTEVSSQHIVIPAYPKPYFRGGNGGVYLRFIQEDGEAGETVVYENDFYVVGRLVDPVFGECAVLRVHLPHDPMREFSVPFTSLTSKEEFRKAVSAEGIMIFGRQVDDLMRYVQDWVRELQQESSALEAKRQFGWTNNNESFILGADEYTRKEVLTNHPSSATLEFFSAFEPKGTLEGWKDMINFYNQDGMEMHQLVVCSAFGSPLMEFMPNISAAGLHIYNKESGLGKTTCMLAACSVWGDPQALVVAAKDTKNFHMNRAEIYKNLPLYLDEVTNSDPKQLSDWAYELTGSDGRQRGRMGGSSNKERARGEPWAFLSVSTGNTSIIERVSLFKEMPKAEAQRILEYRAERFASLTVRQADEFNTKLADNYGHAGSIFIQAIMRKPNAVRQLMMKVKASIDNTYKLSFENRFWSAYLTCCLTAAIIAADLGLISFDYNKLFAFSGKLINQNRDNVDESEKSVSELLVEFMNEHYSNILRINSGNDMLGKAGLATLLPTETPKGQLAGRYEIDTHKLFIVPKALKKWCIKQQTNYSSMVHEMEDTMGATTRSVRMYGGTDIRLPPARAIVLSFEYEDDTKNKA